MSEPRMCPTCGSGIFRMVTRNSKGEIIREELVCIRKVECGWRWLESYRVEEKPKC